MKDWFNDQSFLIVCTSIERPEDKFKSDQNNSIYLRINKLLQL